MNVCPFNCGSAPDDIETSYGFDYVGEEGDVPPKLYYVRCSVCGATGPANELSEQKAIDDWNDRRIL